MKEWAKNSPLNFQTQLSDNLESISDLHKGTHKQLLKGRYYLYTHCFIIACNRCLTTPPIRSPLDKNYFLSDQLSVKAYSQMLKLDIEQC